MAIPLHIIPQPLQPSSISISSCPDLSQGLYLHYLSGMLVFLITIQLTTFQLSSTPKVSHSKLTQLACLTRSSTLLIDDHQETVFLITVTIVCCLQDCLVNTSFLHKTLRAIFMRPVSPKTWHIWHLVLVSTKSCQWMKRVILVWWQVCVQLAMVWAGPPANLQNPQSRHWYFFGLPLG